MKKIILVFSAITTIAVISCNSNSSTKKDQSMLNHDSMTMPMQDNTDGR